jgi:peptidoglycan-N-acetylglucosamine deacetylase
MWNRSIPLAIAVVAASHALLLYPTLRPNVQWFGPVVTHFETSEREVWLTIDDGPTPDTPELIELFARKGVVATFFVKGVLVDAEPGAVRAIVEAGHSVANHSHTHPSGTFWCLRRKAIALEVDLCNEALATAGATSTWFRAPVGLKNPAVHPILDERGMRLIGWSVRAFDAVISDPATISRRIIPRLFPGAIIVLHQGRSYSHAVLERVIDDAQACGYAFVIPEDGRLKTNR